MATQFASKLAETAEDQYNRFHEHSEDDPEFSPQIKRYWTELGFPFQSASVPWSAVFISYCVKKAGARQDEFHFSPQHSEFVFHAIQNAEAEVGVFRARTIESYAPNIGDIIQNNRNGSIFDYDFASTHSDYSSHSAIVIEKGVDTQGNYVMTIGGNESDSIRKKIIRLHDDGRIRQRTSNPYICVIQTLK